MKLTVRNDFGQEFDYLCEQFMGYEVFQEARENWGYEWNTYQVLKGDEVIERVINPMTLDPKSAVRIY
jgi:hypothetical protein